MLASAQDLFRTPGTGPTPAIPVRDVDADAAPAGSALYDAVRLGDLLLTLQLLAQGAKTTIRMMELMCYGGFVNSTEQDGCNCYLLTLIAC